MGEGAILRSFASGELSPGLGARADTAQYQSGLRRCKNFLVRRTGGVANRPGFIHVANCKTDGPTFLFPFVFSMADANFLIEAGQDYFRIYTPEGTLHQELEHPYTTGTFQPPAPLCWHQAGLVVTITHLNYPPMELTYNYATDTFTLTEAVLDGVPSIGPPGGLAIVENTPDPLPEGMLDNVTRRYVVTSVKAGTFEESLIDGVVGLDGLVQPTPNYPIDIHWDAVTDAVEYRVYLDVGNSNTFRYLGTTTASLQFFDIGQEPDLAIAPPQLGPDFTAEFHHPGVTAVHAQRRVFAGSHMGRDLVWLSRVGLLNNFTNRRPIQDDDGIHFRLVTKELQGAVHLVSLQQLVMLTDRGEWVIQGDSDHVITPTLINPLQHGYVGSGWVPPVVYGERILFLQARQTLVRELGFSREVEGLTGRDLTTMGGHLFKNHWIVSMALALVPDNILWCVREDGVLLGLTYIPDEDVLAWHWHELEDAAVEQVCVLPEPGEDAVFVIVQRDGERTIERLATRDPATGLEACFLDSATQVSALTSRTLTGLQHLANREVRVVADGVPLPERLHVSATGELTLPRDARDAWVGFSITAELQTLDLDLSGTDVRNRRKKVTALAFLLEQSVRGFWAGPDFSHLQQVTAAPWEDTTTPFTGRVELQPVAYFNDDGRVCVRHTEPTPLTILGIIPHVDVGG